MRNTKGVAIFTMLLAAIVAAIFLTIVLAFFVPEFGKGFLSLFALGSTGSASTEAIVAECNKYCVFENETAFCNVSRTWDLGDGTVIKGSCFSMSQVPLHGYVKTVDGCGRGFVCSQSEPAECFVDSKKVACETVEKS